MGVRTTLRGVLLAAMVVAPVLPVTLAGAPNLAVAAEPDPPNIVLILTDDQRIDTLGTMPVVTGQILNEGENFTGVVPTSLCCPSRTSILSGRYSHNTGVYKNTSTYGGWKTFHDSGEEEHTIAVALQTAGYRTGLFGKYLNGWVASPEDFVPPGWNAFMAIRNPSGNPELSSGAYYNYLLTGTDPTQWHAKTAEDYSTDVVAAQAEQFVRGSVDGGPFFLMFTPFAPHPPATPAPRHVGTWNPPPYNNNAVNEADMTDKPAFRQGLPYVSRNWIRNMQVKTGESLRAVDEAVSELIAATGSESSNTLFIFMSDNGFLWGDHRLTEKSEPYRWSTDVPLMMRWDNHIARGTTAGLGANIDVSATILDAAGIPQALPIDGTSLLNSDRKELLLEAMNTSRRPAYCGLRTQRWLYVQYDHKNGTELYDYDTDPLELNNLANSASYQPVVKHFRTQTKQLCTPKPPGFSW